MDLDAPQTPATVLTRGLSARLHVDRCVPLATVVLARWSVTDPTTVRLVVLPSDESDPADAVELIVRRELLQTGLSGPARTGGVRVETVGAVVHLEVAGLRIELVTSEVAALLAASYAGAVRVREQVSAR